MNKEKRNIQIVAETESKYLTKILDKEDVKHFKSLIPELKDTWMKKQVFRTDTEMRFSVLTDNKYGTKAAKYWQSVREQNTHFENLIQLSFEARTNAVEIKKLQKKIDKEKDPLERELFEIELEQKIYEQASMELVAKHRIREVAGWAKLKKEFNDGSFDDKDVNTHQAESYLHRLEQMKKTITPGTPQPEVANIVGQLETLKRVRKSGELLPQMKKKRIKHGHR
jgi:predicted S18 family serine protease